MSLNISQKTEQAINEIATRKNVSVEVLLSEFIEREKSAKPCNDQNGLDGINKNRHSAHDDEMMGWFNDLSSDEE